MSSNITSLSIIIGILILFWLLAGCTPPKYMMVQSMDPLMEDMNLSTNRNPDVDFVIEGMPANLMQLDGFITSAPNNRLLLRAAEGYFGYTYSFVEDVDKPRASMLYLKARDYALSVLLNERYFRQNFDSGIKEFTKSLAEFTKEDVPALYWTANSWMAWVGLNINKPEALMDIPKIEALLLRAIELDETYYYGAAHATLGAYYASRSESIGGDPEKAREHFNRAFEISDKKMLFFYVVYAQYYAYQTQDRDLFERILRMVIDSPVDYFPEKNFANEVAKRKARKLLENIDNYF